MAPAPPPSRSASECGLRFKGDAQLQGNVYVQTGSVMQFAKYLQCWLFQLGQDIRSVQNCIQWRRRKKKKERANVFHLPLSTVTVVQMVGLSWQAMFATGNMSHPRGLLHATFTFSAFTQSADSEQVGAQRSTRLTIDAPAAVGIKPVTFQLRRESASPPGHRAPPREVLFDHSCMLATEWSCEKRKCVRARWSIFIHL